MAELAALNVRISGDSGDLVAAVGQAEGSLERLGTQAQVTARQAASAASTSGGLASVFRRNGFAISNAANQFSDLAVQMQMGTSPARALSQQLPQLTAFMGPLASIIGVAAGVLIGLAGNFLRAKATAIELQASLEALNDIAGDLNRANEILRMSTYDLTVQYGAYADEVRRAAESMASLAQAEAAQRLAAAIANVDRALDGLTSRSGSAFRMGTMLTTAIGNVAERFGVTREEARLLEQQFRALETAADWESQVAALREIERLLEESGASASDLPPQLITALQTLNQMVITSGELAGGLDIAAASGARLAGALAMTTGAMGPSLYNDDGSIGMPPSRQGTQFQFGGGAASGGGGGGDRFASELEALQESLLSQEELQIASFERQQETLQEALDRRLITQQEYNDLMQQSQAQHAAAMEGIDVYRYGSTLAKAEQFMGDMAGALQSGNEQMMRISRIFAAGEALVNAWRAYSQVLADPTLPFFAKVPAALSVLSAGVGAVNAIRGAGKGGGGQTTAGASSSGGGGDMGGAGAGGGTSRNVAIQLTGGDMFSRSQVVQLINSINEAVEDGAIVRLV